MFKVWCKSGISYHCLILVITEVVGAKIELPLIVAVSNTDIVAVVIFGDLKCHIAIFKSDFKVHRDVISVLALLNKRFFSYPLFYFAFFAVSLYKIKLFSDKKKYIFAAKKVRSPQMFF